MRRIGAVLAATLLAWAVHLDAQPRRPASPEGTSATQVDGRWIEIVYGRPILRGRTNIFGAGADYGKTLFDGGTVWRAGANVSTRLRSEVPLAVGGKRVAPGEYVLLIDLKLLGLAPALTYATLDRVLPWGLLGFGMNVLTGMTFFVSSPWQYVGNPSMNWKLVFLMGAGLNMLLFTLDQRWERGHESALVTGREKAMAATAIVLWVCVMFFGSMLPFLGQAF